MNNLTYLSALNNRIKSGKVYLNNKQTRVDGYEEVGQLAIVIIDGQQRILTGNDNLIIDGIEQKF